MTQQTTSHDSNIFHVLAITIIAAIALWIVSRPYISEFFFHTAYWVSVGTIWTLSRINIPDIPFLQGFILWVLGPESVLQRMIELRNNAIYMSPTAATHLEIFHLATMTFAPFKVFFVGWGIWMLRQVTWKTKPYQLRSTYDMFKLASLNANQYPWIRPALQANLLKQPQDEGPWARESGPLLYGLKQGLLSAEMLSRTGLGTGEKYNFIHKNAPPHIDLIRESNGLPIKKVKTYDIAKIAALFHGKAEINEPVIEHVCLNNLGDLWPGYEALEDHEKLMYVAHLAFASHTEKNKGKEKAFKLIDHVSKSWETKKGKAKYSYPDIDSVYEEFKGNEVEQKILKMFAYKRTVLMGVRSACIPRMLPGWKGKGKFPPARFQFLKVIDRTLWMALNQIGGHTSWTETMGLTAHFEAEKSAKGALYEPEVIEDIIAYREYMTHTEGWLAS